MENENYFMGNFLYERADDMSVLSDFYCGIYDMDTFIHKSLQGAISREGLDTYLVKDGNEILAVFAICEHSLRTRLSTGEYVNYDTIEIEYLAVRKDRQKCGIGRSIINQIIEKMMQGRNMLSVSAYVDIDSKYSAVPFYEKCGFHRIGGRLHDLADYVRMVRIL